MKTSIGNPPTAVFVRFILNCGISVILVWNVASHWLWNGGMLNVEANAILVREGFRKKIRIFYGLLPNRGAGGSARVVKKPYCFFEKVFFQRACRIILVPPKHVLHLVWSPYVIYTAIRTALKVACKARILGKKKVYIKEQKNKILEWDQM